MINLKNFSILLICFFLIIAGCKKEKAVAVSEKPAIAKEVKAPEITIKDFVDIVDSNSGWLLKTGDMLFLSLKNDLRQLFIERKSGEKTQLTDFADAVDSYSVSPGERYAALLVAKEGNEQYGIYLYDLKEMKLYPQTPLIDNESKYENVIWINDGQFLFVSNEVNKKDFYIYSYDITEKKKTLLVEKKGNNVITDAISADKFLFYTNLGNNTTEPYIFENGKASKIAGTVKGKAYIPEGFFKDGAIVMRTNERQNFDYIELWNKGKKKEIFRDKWGVENVVIDLDSREQAVFCVNEDGYSKCRRYAGEKLTVLDINEGIVTLRQLRGTNLVFRLSRPDLVPRPAIYNLSGGAKLEFGIVDNRGIETLDFVRPVLKKAESFDGVMVPYFLFVPKNSKPPYKAIVSFHGGPEGQYRPEFGATFQYYLKKGFMVVAPNVRGSTGYGQVYMDMDNYKKRMNSVKDGKAIVDALIKEGLAEKGKFIVMGGSYGGFMTVASMALFSDDYRCGIDVVGIVDFENFLKNTKSYRRALREVEYGPLSDPDFLKSISPANMTDKIKGKLLVAHGMNDPRVPVSDAYILLDKLKKEGNPAESLIFEDEGHGFRKKKNRETFNEKAAGFIEGCF